MNAFDRLTAIGTRGFAGLLAILLAACAQLPPPVGGPAQWRPSPNFGERKPNFVIIHATSDDTVDEALHTLTDPLRQVSAHYLVGRNGDVFQLVDERARAWHAGDSKWGADTDLNSVSLGIELDNNGDEPFPDVQISALIALLDRIQERYHIPAANYLGHADIAPRRKVDPSGYFPWARLARHGYGLWCDPPLPAPPAEMDTTLSLRALGYDVSDPDAAIGAFKRHFMQEEAATDLTDLDRSMLNCLLSQ